MQRKRMRSLAELIDHKNAVYNNKKSSVETQKETQSNIEQPPKPTFEGLNTDNNDNGSN